MDHSFSTTETLNPYAASSNVVVDRSPRPPLNAVATEKMQVQFKMCLIANLVSVLMMFGSAIFVECFSLMWPPSTAITENFFSSWLDYAILFAKLASLLIGLPVFVIAIAGMLRFRSWARQLYSFLMIAGILQTVGLGIFNFGPSGFCVGNGRIAGERNHSNARQRTLPAYSWPPVSLERVGGET